jgi:hypothetical protein
MNSRFLLPNKFKKFGAVMAPVGFICWALAQLHVFDKLVKLIIPARGTVDTPWELAASQFWFLVSFMATMFCSFLLGMLFLVFSRERIEDEYTEKVRLESYQFAALFQFILLFILIVLVIITTLTNKKSRLDILVFQALPIFLILLFWIIYFVRFNFILHFSKYFRKK